MQISRFNVASLDLKVAKKGKKTIKDRRPEIKTARGKDKFTINRSACELMNVLHGDFVTICKNNNATSLNDKYIAFKSDEAIGGKVAVPGKKKEFTAGGFNVSAIWSEMIQDSVETKELSVSELREAGLIKNVFTQKNKEGKDCYNDLATVSYSFEVVRIEDEDGNPISYEIGDTTYPEIFILTNAEKELISDEDKKPESKEEKSEEVSETSEEVADVEFEDQVEESLGNDEDPIFDNDEDGDIFED